MLSGDTSRDKVRTQCFRFLNDNYGKNKKFDKVDVALNEKQEKEDEMSGNSLIMCGE